jgi:hypothetical protein
MGECSFNRHYVEAAGPTPARGVEHLRVDAARRMLSDPPFAPKSFAMQAAISMENARVLTALEQQTATAEDCRSSILSTGILSRFPMQRSTRRCGYAKPCSVFLRSSMARPFALPLPATFRRGLPGI